MLFLTLGVSYIISVVGAVVNKRSFASSVFDIADDSEEFVLNSWNGDDFSRLDLLFNTLSSELSHLIFQHKAYPLLHFYHSESYHLSTSYPVPVLDEALFVRDIIALKVNGRVSFHYVDIFGFVEQPHFFPQRNYLENAEKTVEQNYNQLDGIINNKPAVVELEKAERKEKTSVVEQLKSKPTLDKDNQKRIPQIGMEKER